MSNQLPNTRLELLMRLTGVTGKMLSTGLHLDMSLISRWKNGKRKIVNDVYTQQLVEYFIAFENQHFLKVFQSLVNGSQQKDLSTFVEDFNEWLQEPMAQNDFIALRPLQTGKHSNVEFVSYIGNEGRRNAVLEFLFEACEVKKGGRIFLISDEEMSWLTDEPFFLKQWSSLLYQCIDHGYEIHIIHTLKRSLEALYQSFIQWVPLYMTGKVQAYYLQDPPLQRSYQSLFIVEDLFLCEGNNYTGDISNRYTVKTNDYLTVQSRQQNFLELINKANQLNEIYEMNKIPQIMSSVVDIGQNKEDSLFKAEELFFSTMTRDLLEEILEMNEVSESARDFCLGFYDRLILNFTKNINVFTNQHIYNLNTLIEQAEEIEFKAVLLSIITGQEIIIQRHQFIRHIESTIERLQQNDNYEIGLYIQQSTNLPLEELDFWVKEGYYLTMWSKKTYESIQISREPTMIGTVKTFYEQLWNMIPMMEKDKNHVTQHFKKLIKLARTNEQKNIVKL